MSQTSKLLTGIFNFFCTVVSKGTSFNFKFRVTVFEWLFLLLFIWEIWQWCWDCVFCMMEFALVYILLCATGRRGESQLKFTEFISMFSLSLIEACVYLTQGNVWFTKLTSDWITHPISLENILVEIEPWIKLMAFQCTSRCNMTSTE